MIEYRTSMDRFARDCVVNEPDYRLHDNLLAITDDKIQETPIECNYNSTKYMNECESNMLLGMKFLLTGKTEFIDLFITEDLIGIIDNEYNLRRKIYSEISKSLADSPILKTPKNKFRQSIIDISTLSREFIDKFIPKVFQKALDYPYMSVEMLVELIQFEERVVHDLCSWGYIDYYWDEKSRDNETYYIVDNMLSD